MTRAAQLVEYLFAHVAFVLANGRHARRRAQGFRRLRDALVHARQGIGLIFDDDEHLEQIELDDPQ